MDKTPHPIDRHVGVRLKLRRMMLGISQSKLGESLGVTFQQIQKYENGANRISASRLQELARELDVSPGYFYEGLTDTRGASPGGMAESASGPDAFEFLSTNEGLALNRAFVRIKDPKARRAIIDLVNALAAPEP